MAKKKVIPDEVREQVEEIVERFNTEELKSPTSKYYLIHEQNKLRAASSRSFLSMLFSFLVRRPPSENYVFYTARYRGKFLYLDRHTPFGEGPICRLTYTGKMDEWEFVIYKYSRDKYDPDEWFFPGVQHVDGTIEGAMRTGMEAYPA